MRRKKKSFRTGRTRILSIVLCLILVLGVLLPESGVLASGIQSAAVESTYESGGETSDSTTPETTVQESEISQSLSSESPADTSETIAQTEPSTSADETQSADNETTVPDTGDSAGESQSGETEVAESAESETEQTNGEVSNSETEDAAASNADSNGADAASGIADFNDGTSTLANGNYTIQVDETISIQGSSGWNHSWNVRESGIVSLSNRNERTVSVTGLKEGTVTVTHSYRTYSGRSRTETYTITVTAPAEPGTYTLYAYTLIPGVEEGSSTNPDLVWNGMGMGSISGVYAPSAYRVDTIVDDGYESAEGVDITYPDSYPDITVDDITYRYAQTEEEKYQEGYYTITWMRVIVANGANRGNNDYNDYVQDGTYTFHLDGVITLNEKNMYTVQFALQDAGSSNFALIDPETYSRRVESGFSASNLTRPEVNEPDKYPQTKTVNGILYTFDGWYKDESCTEKVDWDTEIINQNTIYYARYIPSGQDVTITKDVTGTLGDVQKDFTFTYSYTDASGAVQSSSFTLRDDGTYEISNIPVGSQLTIIEENAQGYTTSAVYGGSSVEVTGDASAAQKTMTITIQSNINQVIITNNKDVLPDTGINLTSLPYIVILAVAVSGTAAFAVSRRRRDTF